MNRIRHWRGINAREVVTWGRAELPIILPAVGLGYPAHDTFPLTGSVWDSRKRGLAVGWCKGKRQSVRINGRTICVPLDVDYFNGLDAILLRGKYGSGSKLYSSFKERPVPPPYICNHLSALRGASPPPPHLCPRPHRPFHPFVSDPTLIH